MFLICPKTEMTKKYKIGIKSFKIGRKNTKMV